MIQIEQINQLQIGLDEPFHFRCRGCGKCCKNRDDVLLTPADLFRIAKHFGKTPAEIINEYCDCYIGGTSRFPIVRLRPKGKTRACPFLVEKRCLVHKSKPTVCALYPLGRSTATSEKDGIPEGPKYLLQQVDCGSRSKTMTVRKWLEKFNIPLHDEFQIMWHALISDASGFFRQLDSSVSKELLDEMQNALGQSLYTKYDTSQDFLPQFENNVESARELMAQIQPFLDEETQ